MTQMGNIADICKHAGFPFGNFEGVSGLRSKKKGSGRGERARFSTDELRLLFNLPVWNGCDGEDNRLSPGEFTFHDASYWVPMLALYHGPRREEYCGLLVSEIEADAEIPAIRIEPNSVRGLKNPESKRRIPVHPELIRLGFLGYVAALKDIGHVLLFPELKAAAASTPMGDVFDESWQDMRLAALPSAKEDGKVLHSLRHWCNNEMKQAGVAAEIRKDILGHTNDDTNEGRYSDAARLRVMAEALARLPQPTAHLSPFPIRLIERVEKHLAPPTKPKRSAS
jgi:integrase